MRADFESDFDVVVIRHNIVVERWFCHMTKPSLPSSSTPM